MSDSEKADLYERVNSLQGEKSKLESTIDGLVCNGIILESQLSSAQIEVRRFEGEWQECKKELAEAKAEIERLALYVDRLVGTYCGEAETLAKLEKLEAMLILVERDGVHTFTERGENHPYCVICKASKVLAAAKEGVNHEFCNDPKCPGC